MGSPWNRVTGLELKQEWHYLGGNEFDDIFCLLDRIHECGGHLLTNALIFLLYLVMYYCNHVSVAFCQLSFTRINEWMNEWMSEWVRETDRYRRALKKLQWQYVRDPYTSSMLWRFTKFNVLWLIDWCYTLRHARQLGSRRYALYNTLQSMKRVQAWGKVCTAVFCEMAYMYVHLRISM